MSAKSHLSSRSSRSNSRSNDKRPASAPRRIAPPRPSSREVDRHRYRSSDRPRSSDERRPARPKRSPSDKEIGRWFRESMRDKYSVLPRVPRAVASESDIRAMSRDGLSYLEERLMRMSQESGNANGPRGPLSSGQSSYRGNMGELRERAVDRYNTRNSNRVHVGEINDTASGWMRDRMERNLYRRK